LKTICPYCRAELISERTGQVRILPELLPSGRGGYALEQSHLTCPALDFLRHQRSIAGIVARRELMGLDCEEDHLLTYRLATGFFKIQFAGGSWNASLGRTAMRLYELAQLGFDCDHPNIRRALVWIYGRQNIDGEFCEREEIVPIYPTPAGDDMDFLRFGLALNAFVLRCILPLGVADELPVRRALRFLLKSYSGGRYCCPRCTALILAALTWHNLAATCEQIESGLRWMASIQDPEGRWRGSNREACYLILHALTDIDSPLAAEQAHRAFPLLRHLQREDGAWGKVWRAEKTLIVLRALHKFELLERFLRV